MVFADDAYNKVFMALVLGYVLVLYEGFAEPPPDCKICPAVPGPTLEIAFEAPPTKTSNWVTALPEIEVPFPDNTPVAVVEIVIAGVVVAVATVPAKPLADTTETEVTVPEVAGDAHEGGEPVVAVKTWPVVPAASNEGTPVADVIKTPLFDVESPVIVFAALENRI
jgi:hypothetical protein